jgi:murein L,D-transpeptidase YcbB/YkuD
VPLGILKKDVIPKMRKDPGYAARMHMRVLDGAGNEVDPHSVDWNSDRAPNFTIRQDSGTWNALGAVRIDMPNPHSVYMHDTNHKEFFSADYRFQSSGCTRVENPRDLAAWVLEETSGLEPPRDRCRDRQGTKSRRPCRPQDPGGLGVSHRLGDA